MASNTVVAIYSRTKQSVTRALTQYDYGQQLVFEGFELPESYEVHFAKDKTGVSKTVIGDATGAKIPDEYLVTPSDIYAWMYTKTENEGETRYHIIIPVIAKAEPTEEDLINIPHEEPEYPAEEPPESVEEVPENAVVAEYSETRQSVTRALYQYDYGQKLMFEGFDLPDYYEVQFSNSLIGTSKTVIGDPTGASIPDEYLQTGETIFAWVYLHADTKDGATRYQITIPVNRRAKPTHKKPTPVQQDEITQAIAAMQQAVQDTEEARDRAIEAEDSAQASAEEAQRIVDELDILNNGIILNGLDAEWVAGEDDEDDGA